MNELKSRSRNIHIREEEGANFSGNISAMAPENAVKVTSLSDDVMEEFDRMKESILDIPMKDYYEGVIVNDRMAPECRKQILETIKKWKEQINFDFNIYKVWAKGSLLTKRYNDTTDLDISIYTDMTEEQLDEIFSIIPKGTSIIFNGEATSHPMDFYVLTDGEDTPLENMDCVYDVYNDEWVKRDDDYENTIPLEYAIQVANFFINGCAVALSNYENDRVLYDYYSSLDPESQEVSPEEREEKLSYQKSRLKADLDGMRMALRMIGNFRQDAYKGEDSTPLLLSIQTSIDNPHVTMNEQLAKILEKFNIRNRLRKCVEECASLLEQEDTSGLKEGMEKDDTRIAAFTFGRMNPPTKGHLKLWRAVEAVPADGHFIFASHTKDRKKNPLDYPTKAALIKSALKENRVNASFVESESRTIMDVAMELYLKGFTDLVFVGGQDRVDSIVELLRKYNGIDEDSYNFRTINGISAGDRDPDSDGIEGISATKVRNMAISGDFKGFCKGIPLTDSFILKEVYDSIRKAIM